MLKGPQTFRNFCIIVQDMGGLVGGKGGGGGENMRQLICQLQKQTLKMDSGPERGCIRQSQDRYCRLGVRCQAVPYSWPQHNVVSWLVSSLTLRLHFPENCLLQMFMRSVESRALLIGKVNPDSAWDWTWTTVLTGKHSSYYISMAAEGMYCGRK